MSNTHNTPPQSNLMLRLLGGGYLVYLSWDIRDGISQGGPLFLAAVILFALVGTALVVHTLWTLARHDYFRNTPKESEETTEESEEDCEESTDDCEDRTDE